jgi:serine/threonine protein kinase
MKAGAASARAMRRFKREVDVLARLRHPCIAPIFDAGTHDDGDGAVPYFVMEYIPGAKTILEFAADNTLMLFGDGKKMVEGIVKSLKEELG